MECHSYFYIQVQLYRDKRPLGGSRVRKAYTGTWAGFRREKSNYFSCDNCDTRAPTRDSWRKNLARLLSIYCNILVPYGVSGLQTELPKTTFTIIGTL